MNDAETPFEFFTVSYLTRIGNQSAGTLAEFLTGLEHCSDQSIFHHTFQTLGTHHFLTEGFSNDFAQWVLADANRSDLAEQLAALDIRDYVSIAALRSDLCRVVGDYCAAFPGLAGQSVLKDPVGVIRAYRIVKRYFDCQLVLAGGSASDDPEGAVVLKEALREAGNDPDIKILELPAWAPLEVNALQRASTVLIQKSLREGFGLTVSEALWKKKPVVASDGRRHPDSDHPQTHRPPGPFRRRRRVSNSVLAVAPGNRATTRRAWPPACEGEFPHYSEIEALSDPLFDAGPGIVTSPSPSPTLGRLT